MAAEELAVPRHRQVGDSPPEEILRWKDVHKDEPITLIGNGESINAHDLSRIRGVTIGLNAAWKKRAWTYYCMGDQGQFEEYKRARGPIENLKPLFATHTGPPHAVRLHGHPMVGMKSFSFDLAHVGVYMNNTITATGLQLAVWMGGNPIYLVGIDAQGRHFYGGPEIPELKFANQRETFGYFAGYLAVARPELKIVNLNINTRVCVWPRQRFEEVFP